MNQDKLVELSRYDERAQSQLSISQTASEANMFGSATMSSYLRSPYIFYEQKISELIKPDFYVLELGAGTGLHTYSLVKTGAHITATDISPNALKLLEQRISGAGGIVSTKVADIEALPFEANMFDAIVCAGSLSYGNPALVDAEIVRVLKPAGLFICVDSLNHNPIYRFNRWIHYLRGNRTKSTLQRMPDLQRIKTLSNDFDQVETRYFGSVSFAMPIIARLFGEQPAAKVSDYIDSAFSIQHSAFKFVLVAQNLRK